jgi:hypothetical protein
MVTLSLAHFFPSALAIEFRLKDADETFGDLLGGLPCRCQRRRKAIAPLKVPEFHVFFAAYGAKHVNNAFDITYPTITCCSRAEVPFFLAILSHVVLYVFRYSKHM